MCDGLVNELLNAQIAQASGSLNPAFLLNFLVFSSVSILVTDQRLFWGDNGACRFWLPPSRPKITYSPGQPPPGRLQHLLGGGRGTTQQMPGGPLILKPHACRETHKKEV